MEMPKPGAEHKRLEKLAGTWKGTETMYPSPWDPNGGEAQGETRGRVALGGLVVIIDHEQSRDGSTTFEGHGVYTWDADAQEVILHWFDCTGQARDEFRGGWEGDQLTLSAKNPMGHHRMTWDFSKPGTLLPAMDVSQDGKSWSRLFDREYSQVD